MNKRLVNYYLAGLIAVLILLILNLAKGDVFRDVFGDNPYSETELVINNTLSISFQILLLLTLILNVILLIQNGINKFTASLVASMVILLTLTIGIMSIGGFRWMV